MTYFIIVGISFSFSFPHQKNTLSCTSKHSGHEQMHKQRQDITLWQQNSQQTFPNLIPFKKKHARTFVDRNKTQIEPGNWGSDMRLWRSIWEYMRYMRYETWRSIWDVHIAHRFDKINSWELSHVAKKSMPQLYNCGMFGIGYVWHWYKLGRNVERAPLAYPANYKRL